MADPVPNVTPIRADIGKPTTAHQTLWNQIDDRITAAVEPLAPRMGTVTGIDGGKVLVTLDNEKDDRTVALPRRKGVRYLPGDRVFVHQLHGGDEVIGGIVSSKAGVDPAVDREQIFDGAVQRRHIDINAVGPSELDHGAVQATHLASGAVTTNALAPAAVLSGNIASNQITTTHIADNQVTNTKLTTDAVSTTKVAANAITGAKIADGAISNRHLGPDSVLGGNIQANSIGGSDLQAGTVSGRELGNLAVQETHIAVGAVTFAKLDQDTVKKKINRMCVKVCGNVDCDPCQGAGTGV